MDAGSHLVGGRIIKTTAGREPVKGIAKNKTTKKQDSRTGQFEGNDAIRAMPCPAQQAPGIRHQSLRIRHQASGISHRSSLLHCTALPTRQQAALAAVAASSAPFLTLLTSRKVGSMKRLMAWKVKDGVAANKRARKSI